MYAHPTLICYFSCFFSFLFYPLGLGRGLQNTNKQQKQTKTFSSIWFNFVSFIKQFMIDSYDNYPKIVLILIFSCCYTGFLLFTCNSHLTALRQDLKGVCKLPDTVHTVLFDVSAIDIYKWGHYSWFHVMAYLFFLIQLNMNLILTAWLVEYLISNFWWFLFI